MSPIILKPSNVLLHLSADGSIIPRITDFGLAKLQDSEGELSRSGAVLGTPSYVSPEQAAGQPAAPAADLYALGAILYELLVRRPPFQGKSDLEILRQIRDEEPAPPRRLRRGIPRDLETICLKCLRNKAQARYACAQELADDLIRHLEGRPGQARRLGMLERGARQARRHPATAAVLGIAVLALRNRAETTRRKKKLNQLTV